MKKVFRIALVIAFVGLFVGTMVFIYQKSQKEEVVYETNKPFVTDITKKIVATGSIVPEKEVDIKPKISGLLDKIYIEPGDQVKRGQSIAKVTIIPNMVSLNEAESRLRKAKITLTNAKNEYDRNAPLAKDGIITDEEFQKYSLEYKNAEEEHASAKDNVSLIKKGVKQSTQKETNTLISSTIDGMVLDVPIKEGSSVIESNNFNEGTTVAQIADVSKMVFKGVVDESDVNKLSEDMPIRLTVGAIEGKIFNAKISFIAPKGTDVDGTVQFDIEATVELREDAFIRVGYSANADVIIEEKTNVLAINEGLLQFDDKGAFVELQKGSAQVFEKVYVKTGLSDGINVEVLSGIDSTSNIKKWDVKTSYK